MTDNVVDKQAMDNGLPSETEAEDPIGGGSKVYGSQSNNSASDTTPLSSTILPTHHSAVNNTTSPRSNTKRLLLLLGGFLVVLAIVLGVVFGVVNNRPTDNTTNQSKDPSTTATYSTTAMPSPAPNRVSNPTITPTTAPNTDSISESTMVPLLWDAQNHAVLEFCQGSSSQSYGYRLPGTTTCEPAGVVLRMTPGTYYQLTIRNTLPTPPNQTRLSTRDITNLHIHGVHVAGSGNADDITRQVPPGHCLTYHWDIPANHMGGTLLFHAHNFGSTAVHIQGGAYGVAIIEENDNVLDQANVTTTEQEAIRAWMDNELLLIAGADIGPNRAYVINGKELDGSSPLTVFSMVQGEWYRLRVAVVEPTARRIPLQFPDDCVVHVAAYDGVWKFQTPNSQVERSFIPTGASRIDVAIQCPTEGNWTIQFDHGKVDIATLHVTQGTTTGANPFRSDGSSWRSTRPSYLRDLSDGDVAFGEFERQNLTLNFPYVNGQLYNPEVPLLTVNYNTLQEWTLLNSGLHPFHAHTWHLQTFNCTHHDDGEYYDTISASPLEEDACTVRFHLVDFTERLTVHCHDIVHGTLTSMNTHATRENDDGYPFSHYAIDSSNFYSYRGHWHDGMVSGGERSIAKYRRP